MKRARVQQCCVLSSADEYIPYVAVSTVHDMNDVIITLTGSKREGW